jgi:hypothetical protein
VSHRGGRLFAPDVLDQPLIGHDLVRTEQQRGEDGALLGPAEFDRPAVRVLGAERAEDAKPKCT